jgi:hypothetical protein
MNIRSGLLKDEGVEIRQASMILDMATTLTMYLCAKICSEEEINDLMDACKERFIYQDMGEYEVTAVIEEVRSLLTKSREAGVLAAQAGALAAKMEQGGDK